MILMLLRKAFFHSTKRNRRKKKIRKFSTTTTTLYGFQTNSLQSTPLPSALIVAQRFVSVWCSCPRTENPTASRVPTVGNERALVALGGL